tara:strand:+ start:362 stop:550 length:189 start_codon:yes stop_codon:yes gene_type:complete
MFSEKLISTIAKLDKTTIAKLDEEIEKNKIKKRFNLPVISPMPGKGIRFNKKTIHKHQSYQS